MVYFLTFVFPKFMKYTLDKLYFNEKLEEEYKDVFEDICTLLDKLMVVRMDFEELRDKVMRNDV